MNRTKGFTMIELLIVIGVLGILAVGVLAAVDPFEQLKKARDTNLRQSVISLHTAFTRYYATHANLPWDMATLPTDPQSGTTCTNASAARPAAVVLGTDVNMQACVSGGPEVDGELKPGFVAALGTGVANGVFVSSPQVATVYICFSPASRSVFSEDATKFDSAGNDESGVGGLCTVAAKATLVSANAVGTVCHYCAK